MKLFSALHASVLLVFFTYKDVSTHGFQITVSVVLKQFMSLKVHFNNMQHVLLNHFLSRFQTKTLYVFLIPPIDAEHATHPFTFMGKDELKLYIKIQSVPRGKHTTSRL